MGNVKECQKCGGVIVETDLGEYCIVCDADRLGYAIGGEKSSKPLRSTGNNTLKEKGGGPVGMRKDEGQDWIRCTVCNRGLVEHNGEYWCKWCEWRELTAAGYCISTGQQVDGEETNRERVIRKLSENNIREKCIVKEGVVRGVDISIMKGMGVYWIMITDTMGKVISIDVDEERALRVAEVLGMEIL
jgi:uncharacterized Zn finger protein (UPF0148 family)